MEEILNLKFLTIANDLKNISQKSVALARLLNKCQSDKCLQQVLKNNTYRHTWNAFEIRFDAIEGKIARFR